MVWLGEVTFPVYRAVAVALVVAFGSAGVGTNWCPMRPAGPDSPARNAHDCCKKGITGWRPSCCHADRGAAVQATVKSALPVIPVLAVSRTPELPPFELRAGNEAQGVVFLHGPPSLILRI